MMTIKISDREKDTGVARNKKKKWNEKEKINREHTANYVKRWTGRWNTNDGRKPTTYADQHGEQ